MPVTEKTTASDSLPRTSMAVNSGVNFFSPDSPTDLFGDAEPLRRTKYLPEQLLTRYLQEALKLTVLKTLDDGAIFAEIPGFDGVWASDQDLPSCIAQLRDVLFDWLVIKIEHSDRDIPVVADINLNVI